MRDAQFRVGLQHPDGQGWWVRVVIPADRHPDLLTEVAVAEAKRKLAEAHYDGDEAGMTVNFTVGEIT